MAQQSRQHSQHDLIEQGHLRLQFSEVWCRICRNLIESKLDVHVKNTISLPPRGLYTVNCLKLFKLTFSGAGKAAILRSANEENNVVDIVCDVGLVIGVESNLLSNNIIDQYKSRYSPAQSS